MRKYENLVGKKFNRLLVIEEAPRKSKFRHWKCLCDCGKEIIVSGCHLKSGHTKSCGCLSDEKKRVLKRDLTGMTFGSLKVLERDSSREGVYWKCLCVCGKEVSVESGSLIKHKQISCGCIGEQNRIKACTKHGKATVSNGKRTCKLYSVWDGMKQRCTNKNHSAYKWYGAIGINVCEQWKNDFENFYEWAMENGYKEGLQIDRINYKGNYEPENCRWVTPLEQACNKGCFDLEDEHTRCIPKVWQPRIKECTCGEFPKMRVGKVFGSEKLYGKALCLKCRRSIEIPPEISTQYQMWKKLINEWNNLERRN